MVLAITWPDIWQYLFVGAGTFVVDFLWVSCVIAVSRHSALRAALTSMALILVSAMSTVVYVSNPRTIIAACIGAGAGTYLSVRRAK